MVSEVSTSESTKKFIPFHHLSIPISFTQCSIYPFRGFPSPTRNPTASKSIFWNFLINSITTTRNINIKVDCFSPISLTNLFQFLFHGFPLSIKHPVLSSPSLSLSKALEKLIFNGKMKVSFSKAD